MSKILQYNPRLKDLLSGKIIDTSMRFDVSFMHDRIPVSRIETLIKLTAGQKILHVGCADHPELIEQKIENSNHLHSILVKNCEVCTGLDTNIEAIDKLKELGMNDVHTDIADLPRDDYDIVILGEVLEHNGDAVSFLKEFIGLAEQVIVTVPNAYSALHAQMYFQRMEECVNSDHRFWFTPWTLLKVMHDAGLEVRELLMADPVNESMPHTSTTLVAVGERYEV